MSAASFEEVVRLCARRADGRPHHVRAWQILASPMGPTLGTVRAWTGAYPVRATVTGRGTFWEHLEGPSGAEGEEIPAALHGVSLAAAEGFCALTGASLVIEGGQILTRRKGARSA